MDKERNLKRKCLLALWTGAVILLSACSVESIKEEKIKDLEYTVVPVDEVPEELMTQIEEEKKEPMKITFSDKGYLYIVHSYGIQETSGYSIEVKELYETDNSICIETELLGPKKTEEIIEAETYPFVVVKIEENEKYVVFD